MCKSRPILIPMDVIPMVHISYFWLPYANIRFIKLTILVRVRA